MRAKSDYSNMPYENRNGVLPHIRLTKEWIERFLPLLRGREFKTYIKLACHYNVQKGDSFPSGHTIAQAIGCREVKTVYRAIRGLEEKGLIEVVKNKKGKGWANNVYHLLYVDDNGYHRAEKSQLSLREALKQWKEGLLFSYELFYYQYKGEEQVLQMIKERYPDFRLKEGGVMSRTRNQSKDLAEATCYDFCPYFISYWFDRRYSQLRDSYPKEFNTDSVFREIEEKEEAITRSLEGRLYEAQKDLEHCIFFIDAHPEVKSLLLGVSSSKRKELLVQRHPEILEIVHYNHGIFKELGQKHGFSPLHVHQVFVSLMLSRGSVGFISDLTGYICDIELGEPPGLLEEEGRLLSLEEEDFTESEKRDYEGTCRKIKTITERCLEYLVDRAGEELARAYLEGQVRKYSQGIYIPPKTYAKKTIQGEELVYEEGVEPEKWGLEALLQRLAYKINDHIAEYRGESPDSTLVTVAPVELKRIKESFDKHLKMLKAESGGNKN